MLDPLPKAMPRWPPIVRVIAGFLELLRKVRGKSERLSVVEAVREFDRLRGDLTALGLEPPRADASGPLQWPQVTQWMLLNTRELIHGRHGIAFKAA